MYTYNGSIAVPLVTEASKAREAKRIAERNAKLDQPIACYKLEWDTVNNVEVLTIQGMAHILAVPNSGKRNAVKFDIIDRNTLEFVCQLKKSEVFAWMSAKAKALDVPFNAVS